MRLISTIGIILLFSCHWCYELLGQEVILAGPWEYSIVDSGMPDETTSWQDWDSDDILPVQESIWLRTTVDNESSDTVRRILYLGGAQDCLVDLITDDRQTNTSLRAGTLISQDEVQVPAGVILSGLGHSAQVWLHIPPGRSTILLHYKAPIYEHVNTDIKLYNEPDWHQHLVASNTRTFFFQGIVLGALLIISLYHFLIYLLRRDQPFLWYSLYTITVAVILSLETGVLQSLLWKEGQWAYRIIWETQSVSMIGALLYFVFMRSFLDLHKLIPWLDRFVRTFILIYLPFALALDIHYALTLRFTVFNFIFPLSMLCLGLFCVYHIVRSNNLLAMYFSMGSLVLFVGAFFNTMISIFVDLHWISEPVFPRIWISEFGIILEILIFSLGLGYRLRLLDQEKEQAVTRLRTKISSDLHDDVGSMLTGLSMQSNVMSYTSEGPMKEKLVQISEISRRALETMRDTVWAIDARRDNFVSLFDKMTDFAEHNIPQERMSYQLNTHGIDQQKKIAPDIRQQLYLIYKEAITNAVKHSDGDLVSINLYRTNGTLILTVHDNGSKQPSDYASGQGIQNMEMRVQNLGGTMKLTFYNGCKVEVEVSL